MASLDPGDFAYDDERQHVGPDGPEADDETCQVVEVDGEPVLVHGDLSTPEDLAAFAEIVRAAKRRFAEVCGGRDPMYRGVCAMPKGHPGGCFDDPWTDA